MRLNTVLVLVCLAGQEHMTPHAVRCHIVDDMLHFHSELSEEWAPMSSAALRTAAAKQ